MQNVQDEATNDRALVLRSARLIGAATDEPVDLHLVGDRVARVLPAGSSAPAGAEVQDLAGRYVLPGMWDHHVHFRQWAVVSDHLDLSETRSAADVLHLVQQRAAQDGSSPERRGEALIGYGLRDGLWPDSPDLAALDAVVPDRPVALAGQDMHCAWLNSAALRAVGAPTRPDGVVREDEFAPVLRRLSSVTPERLDGLARDAAARASARGIVGIVDLENDRNMQVWQERHRAGIAFFRVECSVYPENLDWAIDQGWRTGDVAPGTDGLITMGPLKVITDGSLNTRTAWCCDAYPGLASGTGSHGIQVVSPQQLRQWLVRAHDNGISAAVHAIGDRANTDVLDVFESVGCGGRVEHGQLVSDVDFPRFAQLGIQVSVQPVHAVDDRDVADRHWAGRTHRAFAFGSLLAAGAELLMGSDAPVAPLDPWLTVAAAVHRSGDDRPPWHPEQSIGVEAALAASVRAPLRVGPGHLADLVVTDLDPLTAELKQLRQMPVHATFVGGRKVWQS